MLVLKNYPQNHSHFLLIPLTFNWRYVLFSRRNVLGNKKLLFCGNQSQLAVMKRNNRGLFRGSPERQIITTVGYRPFIDADTGTFLRFVTDFDRWRNLKSAVTSNSTIISLNCIKLLQRISKLESYVRDALLLLCRCSYDR